MTLFFVFVYMAVTMYVSYWAAKRTKTESDYLVAGRSLPYGVTVFAIFATWFGAETCTGAAGAVYEEGWRGARLDPFGYMFCLLLYALVFAAPFWRKKITTLADLFRARFSPGTEKLAAIILIPTSMLWAAAQIGAFGHIIASLSNDMPVIKDLIDVKVGIGIAAISVIIYTASGGTLGDALNDVIQGVILIIGFYILAGIVIWDVYSKGQLGTALAAVQSNAKPEAFAVGLEAWLVPIVGSVISQELVARSMSARSPQVARSAGFTAGFLYLIVGLAPITVGLIAQTVMPGVEESEQVLSEMAKLYMHGFAYAVLIGALVSAILSTVDSALLACGGLFSHNLLIPILDNPTEKVKLRVSRWTVVTFGVLSTLLTYSNDSVRDLVEQASSFGSAGIFTCVVFGLFTRFGGVYSAYASLIAGVSVYCALSYGPPVFGISEENVETLSPWLQTLIQTPYMFSIVAALLFYISVAVVEKVPPSIPVLKEATEEE
jgi:SSS family solute:Na+ symporter